jgi:hypothetical protein
MSADYPKTMADGVIATTTHKEDSVTGSAYKEGEFVDDVERMRTADEIAELSGIENEATSKAAWLFSLCASIGGFLFGEYATLVRWTAS